MIHLLHFLVLFFLVTGTFAHAFDSGADDLENATVIPSPGLSETTDLTLYTAQSEEPQHYNYSSAQTTAWWTWTAPDNGFYTVYAKAVPKGPSKVHLALFQGQDKELVSWRTWDDGNPAPYGALSRIVFWAQQGQSYYFQLDQLTEQPSSNGQVRLGLAPMKAATRQGALTSVSLLGNVSVQMEANGRFTGRILYIDHSYSFKGSLTADGSAEIPLQYQPGIDEDVPPDFRLRLTCTYETWEVRLLAFTDTTLAVNAIREVTVFNKLNPNPMAGRYTAQGRGDFTSTLLMNVSPSGRTNIVYLTSEGKKITLSVPLHNTPNAEARTIDYCKLLPKKNALMISLDIQASSPHENIIGTVLYQYPDRLVNFSSLEGGRYTRPRRPTAAEARDGSLTHLDFLPFSNPKLDDFVSPGILDVSPLGLPYAAELSFDLQGRFKVIFTECFASLKLQAATGLVTGQVKETYEDPRRGLATRIRKLTGCLSRINHEPTLSGFINPLTKGNDLTSPGDFNVTQ